MLKFKTTYTHIKVGYGVWKYLPRLDTNTSPNPIPRGAPQLRNFSLGAQTAMEDSPAEYNLQVHVFNKPIESLDRFK